MGDRSPSRGATRRAPHAVPGYRADIDGLRALAILPVLLFHLGVPGLPGGFVGVDIFFVISGFVITRGLWADLDSGRFSLGGFYERRVRRLLPALGATLAATTIAAWLVLLPSSLIHYSQSLAASAVSAANLFLWVGSSYFAPDSRQVPLMHLWSLAVEEQFYLLFPVLLAAGHHRFRRACGPAFLALALISFAFNLLLLPVAPSATFFLLPTRLWELLAGALLALYPVRAGPGWWRHTAAAAGIALIALPVLTYDELTPFPGIAASPPVLGAAALILAGFPQGDGHPATLISRLLSAPPLVFVGRLSYPLYLVHWPIIVLVREVTMREPSGAMIAAMILGSVALAWAIQRWVEQPLRYARADRRTVIRLAAVVLLAAALAGILGVATRGAPGRLALPAPQSLLTDARWGKGRCFFEGGADPLVWRETACTRVRAAGPKVLLWGDSFAAHYVPGLEANAGNVAATIVQYTAAACTPLLDTSGMTPTCRAFDAHVLDVVRRGRFTHVIIAARWQNWRARGFDALPATVAALREAGASVTVIGQTPLFAADVQTIAYRTGATGPEANRRTAFWPIAVDRGINQSLRRAASGANFVDPVAILCGGDSCPYKAGSSFLFADDGHFSAVGSSRAVQLLFPFIRDRADRDFGDPAPDPAARPPLNNNPSITGR
jgi:peptidoglycan/LPS O-acetylase OafA/YrhL